MKITIRMIVEAACSDITLLDSANKMQQIFLISDTCEAKLIFDLLQSYGFEAKLYNEDDSAKLYVSAPRASRMSDTDMLKEMYGYAATFIDLKKHVEQIANKDGVASPAYSLSFTNTASQDKQITINLAPAKRFTKISNKQPSPNHEASAKTPVKSMHIAKKSPSSKSQDGIFEGPEIMRPAGRRKSTSMETDGPDSLWKQFKLYIKGNSMAAGLIFFACLAVLIVVFSMFIVSKAFLCPDFAHLKDENPPWYCGASNADKK